MTSHRQRIASVGDPGGTDPPSKRAATFPDGPRAPARSAHYLRVRTISVGGMGRVELVVRREGRFERLYARKRIRAELLDDSAIRQMFMEEARVAGLVHHPNVVPVLDVGEDDEGPFLLMDFIDGVTVKDLVARARQSGLMIPVQVCARIAAQAASGLHAAHTVTGSDGASIDLVHRDVSPHNILVGYDGVVRVTDFGIAKADGRDVHTSAGVLKGRLGYMSPEYLRLHRPSARADVFSLGVVLYELLAADRAYAGGDEIDRARRILEDPPPDIGERRRDVPASLEGLLLRMLAKEPQARPSAGNAAEELTHIADGLAQEEGRHDVREYVCEAFANERLAATAETRRLLADLAVSPPQPEPARLADRPTRRRRWLVWTLPLGLAAAVAIGASVHWGPSAEGEPAVLHDPEVREAAPVHREIPGPRAVRLSVTSDPSGADVRLDGVGRGRTPLDLALSPSDAEVTLTAELDAHAAVTQTLRLQEDVRVHLVLRPEAQRPRVTRPRVRTPSKRGSQVRIERLPE